MTAERFNRLVRALLTTPSRRAVNRALAGVAAGMLLTPLQPLTAAGKGKANKRRRKKKKKEDEKIDPKTCERYALEFCPAGGYSDCCRPGTDSQGERLEICTECGCCASRYDKCCFNRDFADCCHIDDTCAIGEGGGCCPKGRTPCPIGGAAACCIESLPACCGGVCCKDSSCDMIACRPPGPPIQGNPTSVPGEF